MSPSIENYCILHLENCSDFKVKDIENIGKSELIKYFHLFANHSNDQVSFEKIDSQNIPYILSQDTKNLPHLPLVIKNARNFTLILVCKYNSPSLIAIESLQFSQNVILVQEDLDEEIELTKDLAKKILKQKNLELSSTFFIEINVGILKCHQEMAAMISLLYSGYLLGVSTTEIVARLQHRIDEGAFAKDYYGYILNFELKHGHILRTTCQIESFLNNHPKSTLFQKFCCGSKNPHKKCKTKIYTYPFQ